MIKAIIFDCFGVLTTDYWKEFVATLDSGQAEPARALLYQYDAAQIDFETFLRQVKDLTGRIPHDVEGLLFNQLDKNTGLLDYIAQLKPDYKIGLLSNVGSGWIREKFLDSDERELFDDMVLSYEVGLVKPSPEIFEMAAKNLGAALNECVFVDDSQGHCSAAAQLGMQAIHYQNLGQFKQELELLLANSKG